MNENDNGQSDLGLNGESPRYKGKLYSLFVDKLPSYVKDSPKGKYLDVQKLAGDMSLVRQTVYQWFWHDYVDASHVQKIIALPESKLTEADFLPFIFKA